MKKLALVPLLLRLPLEPHAPGSRYWKTTAWLHVEPCLPQHAREADPPATGKRAQRADRGHTKRLRS